jgi:predicted Ser/Thr protein kinase
VTEEEEPRSVADDPRGGVVENAVRIGELLAGRYAVEQELGRGTMAFVVKARDHVTEELVACKIPIDNSAYRVDGLIDQYRLLRKLKSPQLPGLFAMERHKTEESSFEFLVLEFIEGQPLDVWAPGQTLRHRMTALAAIAETVQVLAAEGTGHGDLWAPNVVVQPGGRVVLIDPDGSEYSSSRRARGTAAVTGGGDHDLPGLQAIVQDLISVAERDVIRSVFESFSRQGAPRLSSGQIASAVRFAMSLPFLPGERDLATRAQDYRLRVLEDERMFLEICKLRHSAFVDASSMLGRLTETFGITLQRHPDFPPGDELLQKHELPSAHTPTSGLYARRVIADFPHGDRLDLYFNGKGGFRKPWPHADRRGLIDTGLFQVVREGKPVLAQTLELWFRENAVVLVVAEPSRYLPFDESIVERALRVVTEQLVPGLESPRLFSKAQTYGMSAVAQDYLTVKGWLEARGRPVPDVTDDQWRASFVEMVLSGSPALRSTGLKTYHSRLTSFFAVPPTSAARLELVRAAALDFQNVFGGDFSPFYRLDVQPDESSGQLNVTFEGGSLRHSFDMGAGTPAMRARLHADAQGGRSQVTKIKSWREEVNDLRKVFEDAPGNGREKGK